MFGALISENDSQITHRFTEEMEKMGRREGLRANKEMGDREIMKKREIGKQKQSRLLTFSISQALRSGDDKAL